MIGPLLSRALTYFCVYFEFRRLGGVFNKPLFTITDIRLAVEKLENPRITQ